MPTGVRLLLKSGAARKRWGKRERERQAGLAHR